MARQSNLDITNASKTQKEQWAKLRTEELENLYASMSEQLAQVPAQQWSEWDKHSIKLIGEIVGERRANEVRKEIARMMELAGVHYGIERTNFWRKRALRQGVVAT
jgi:hypothetical protein